jgi:superfamily II DNA/RNA helicase
MDFKKLGLWPHQRAAVKTCEAYFASNPNRSALVHLPTGTGKTGVMAVIAAMRSRDKAVLVICPSAALAKQLVHDISTRFWEKIGAPAEWRPDKTLLLLPSEVEAVAEALRKNIGKRIVVCATIQATQQIFAEQRHLLLSNSIGTVLFDEGHREPAQEWARAVRAFAVPTVLFSATPYRNDLKLFDVESGWISFLSFAKAVENSLIRGVEIQELSLSRDASEFAKQIVAIRSRCILEERFAPDCKVIVRANSEGSVRALFTAFEKALRGTRVGVLAIHNNFENTEELGQELRGDVPPQLYRRTERYLIHQHMLTEGIDDPACAILALYDPFTNERQLVQQVGRVTRHPSPGSAAPKALVVARQSDGALQTWRRFLSYDQACVDNGGKPPVRSDREVLESLVEALPQFDYVGGRFRSRVTFDSGISSDLRFPKAAVVFEIDANFSLNDFQQAVTAGLGQQDRYEAASGSNEDGDCRFHVSLSLSHSPFLEESIFQSASLEVTVYAKHGNRLLFFDSAGLWMDEAISGNGRVRGGVMSSLLPENPDCVVTSLAIKNADLGPLALRSRSMSGRSLATSGLFMGEQTYVVNRVTGRFAGARRNLTLARGRIRQEDQTLASADQYFEWTKEICDELDEQRAASIVFDRYASPIDTPDDTTPLNILIDVENLNGEFVDDAQLFVEIDAENSCVDVAEGDDGPSGYSFWFDLQVAVEKVRVWIRWDREKKKYWLASSELSAIKLRENAKITLAHRLNQQQPFRLIPRSPNTLYAYGRFYSTNLRLDRPSGPAKLVLDLLTPIASLRSISSEKGNLSARAVSWPDASLFGFIDKALLGENRRSRPLGEGFDYLVCDDLGQEVADFIGVTEGNTPRLALIAAKWKAGIPAVSAAALYDVCSQAVKNLAYMKLDSQELPGSPQKWNHDWALNGGRVPRMRAGTSSAEFRRKFATVRATPSARREMWLVLGGGVLSKGALESGFRRRLPQPHVLQTFHLLLSVLSSSQSVGVELKIFCAE